MASESESQVRDLIARHEPQERCVGCPFGGPRVGSKGAWDSPIVFVGESPGIEEVKKGAPLVGPSGKIFHKFVPEDGSVLILNAMECRPLSGLKKDPTMNHAAQCCHDHLLAKIQLHPRRLIVTMGNYATRSLTGNYHHKITQIRGRLIPSPLAELGIMPVVHVAALMRGTGSYRQWKQDMAYAMDLGLGASPTEYTPAEVQVVPDDADQQYVDYLFTQLLWGSNELTADIETTGLNHKKDRILSIGITPANDVAISYCFYPHHLPLIKAYLESEKIAWCWHNGKFDIAFLREAGVQARVDDDTMLMSYALDELGGVHDLETVSADVLGAPDYKYMIKPWLPNKKASYELVPPDVLAAYQAIDTSNTAQIRPIYRRRVRRDPDLEKLYTQTLIPASETLYRVQNNGIRVDPERFDENEVFFQDMKDEYQGKICDMAGYSLNPGSPQQVAYLLFRKLRMPNRHKGSTDEKTLLWLQKKTEHPIIQLILQYRKAVKMYGTYVKGYRKCMDPETYRIHTTYLIHGSRTGRLASRDPNIQNPPRLPQIRGTFVASPGYELLEVDLKQAELTSLAAVSKDPDLMRVYIEKLDLHTDLAIYLFPGWEERYASEDEDTHHKAYEQRVKCKNVNFGIVYGITPWGLMEQINDTKQAAEELLKGWADRYPVAWKFINRCRKAPLLGEDITTCFGRRKRSTLVSHENVNFLMNEAANFPHQSIASDINLHAAIRTEPILRQWGVRIVNLVHDAILMEVPITPGNETRNKAIELVQREMAQVPRDFGITNVPFGSDAEVGDRWGSLVSPEKWDGQTTAK